MLEFRLCASLCWTWWQVGSKHNESLINITWHLKTKTRDSKTMTTSIQTQTPRWNVSQRHVQTGHGFWSRNHQVMTSHSADCCCLETAGDGSPQDHSVFLVDPCESLFTSLNSSCGVICCRELSGMTEAEIKRTAGTGCCWGPQGDGEEGYWEGPHQHPASDLQHARNAHGDYGQLSKGEKKQKHGFIYEWVSDVTHFCSVWKSVLSIQVLC